MIRKIYTYNEQNYYTESAVRQAIAEQENKAFGVPETAEEWLDLGVVYTEEEIVEPVKTLDQLKTEKLIELNREFDRASERAYTESSLGFTIDADATAKRNLDGLITSIEEGALEPPVYFMDYNNELHPVDLAGLKTMRLEVIANGQALYQAKWAIRNAIESAESEEQLNEISINL